MAQPWRCSFLGLAVDAPPFFSRPCFILARKVCAKLCFCIFCLWMGSSTFHEIVGGKGMFLCFYVFWKWACGHPLRYEASNDFSLFLLFLRCGPNMMMQPSWWRYQLSGDIRYKTDTSKRRIVGFGGKMLTDEKSPPLFFRSIFIPTHHFLCFCLFFFSVPADSFGKCCGRRLGGQFGQFIAKSPL